MTAPESRPDVLVDRERCIGSGQCMFYAPRTFDLDADNRAYVIDKAGDPPDIVATAVEECPTEALSFAPHAED
jgi:ferredoxin